MGEFVVIQSLSDNESFVPSYQVSCKSTLNHSQCENFMIQLFGLDFLRGVSQTCEFGL